MHARSMRIRSTLALLTFAAAAIACGGSTRRPIPVDDIPRGAGEGEAADDAARGGLQLYRRAGLIVEGTAIPYVGNLHFLAGPTADSTLVLVALSLSNSGLTFAREGGGYRAGYEVTADFSRGVEKVKRVESREQVRVASFMETTRSDESIIFQDFLNISPGEYLLRLTVRDVESARRATVEADVTIPTVATGRLSTPIPVHEATGRARGDSIPTLISRPRATATFGRDTTLTVYLEAYGGEFEVPVQAVVRQAEGVTVWSDSFALARRGALFSGTVDLPVGALGIGSATLVVTRPDTRDSAQTPVFIGFGDNLPLISFTEMVELLQYYASPEQLRRLRDATPAARATEWTAFLRETDPVLSTAEHEGLREYFGRIRTANARFRDDGEAGWRSDRGRVFIALGEPDQILEESRSDLTRRGRVQLWEYRVHRVRLMFVDQSGFGRWELTPTSHVEFQTLVRRLQQD